MSADTKMSDTGGVNYCACMNHGVERLGVANYLNLEEVNSFIGTNCMSEGKCASQFAGPTGLASSFNRTMWFTQGDIISTELRAFNNHQKEDVGPYLVALTGYGPNINIERDPRYGRNSELPGEDPYLTGTYASQMVRGMQVGSDVDPKYLKMIAGVKHFAAYSVEDQRYSREFNISQFDLYDTYLRQYKMAFGKEEGNAMATMCSYAGINGVPSCANDWLLNKVLREDWKRPEVMVVSDCTAVKNLYLGNVEHGLLKPGNHYANNETDAAMKAVNGGVDIEMGTGQFFTTLADGGKGYLSEVVSQGLVSKERINKSLERILEKRFITGLFDPIPQQKFMQIPVDVINSTAHWEFVLDSTLQSLVLLRNDENTLPFPLPSSNNNNNTPLKLAILGPIAFVQRDLFEDYKGPECIDNSDNCVETIGAYFQRNYIHNSSSFSSSSSSSSFVSVHKGVDINSTGIYRLYFSISLCRIYTT